MVHSGGPPPTMAMADIRENSTQETALARLITSSAATAGARASQPPLRANYVVPLSGGAGHFGHAKQPPATNTCLAWTMQPNNHLFGWTVPLPNNRPRPLLSPALHPASQPVQPRDRVVGIGTSPLPPPGERSVPRPWAAPPNGNGPNPYATSWAAAPVARMPPRVRPGGPVFSAGGSAGLRFVPVPDKSFEEFLVERGVLDGPIDVSPPPPPNASREPRSGLGAVRSSLVESAGLVNCTGGGGAYRGGLASVAVVGTAPSGGQMGLRSVRGSEAPGAVAVGGRGRGRAAADEAKERRRQRMAKNREAAARARARKLAAARGSPVQNQGEPES